MGRRKGVPNKLKKEDLAVIQSLTDIDSKALAGLPISMKRSPKAVLLASMEHFEMLAVLYADRAAHFAKKARGREGDDMDKADMMHRAATGFILNAAECAAKVAPFVHAKVADGAQDTSERFVMRLPSVAPDSTSWATAIGATPAPVVDQSATVIENMAPASQAVEASTADWLESVAKTRKSA